MTKSFNFRELKTLKFWRDILIISIAMFIAAASVYYFLMPSNLIMGSITGLSMVISGLFGGALKVSTIVLIVNALLLVAAYFLIGAEFGLKTAYSALILGPFIDIWEMICPNTNLIEPGKISVMGDIWFDLLCFVLILSITQAILFRLNASTGGLDILAKIVNKYFHFDIGTSVTIAGVMICCTAFAVNPFRMVVIGLLGTWFNGLIVDYFMVSLSKKKRICIIATPEEQEKIRKFIIEEIVRGCSLYEVTGGYSNEKKIEIQSILNQDEFVRLMTFISENDIKAFITAGTISEVYGLWSDNKRRLPKPQNNK